MLSRFLFLYTIFYVSFAFCGEKEFSFDELVLSAQSAYLKGDTKQAFEKYNQALSIPESVDQAALSVVRKNAGLAALSSGLNQEAADLYRMIPGNNGNIGLAISLFRSAEERAVDNVSNATQKASFLRKTADIYGEAATLLRESIFEGQTDPIIQTNLVASIERIPDLLQKAKQLDLEAKYGEKRPDELLTLLMKEQESSYSSVVESVTNSIHEKIEVFEKTANQQKNISDIWSILDNAVISQVGTQVTNEESLLQLKKTFATAKDRAECSSFALEDLNQDAFISMKDNNLDAILLFSFLSDPLTLINKSIFTESNAVEKAVDIHKFRTPKEDQDVVKGLFTSFKQKLPSWLDQINRQSSLQRSNQPKETYLTKEEKETLDRLINETDSLLFEIQINNNKEDNILSEPARRKAFLALENMLQIKKLLEKTQPPQQQKENDQKQQSQKKENKEDSQQQNQPESSQNEQQSEQTTKEQESQSNIEKKDDDYAENDPEEKEAKALMEAILEQEKQREEDKKRKRYLLPVNIGERDW